MSYLEFTVLLYLIISYTAAQLIENVQQLTASKGH